MAQKPDKVAVAMSGGVDSSVAAALLKHKGYDITGVTMILTEDCRDFLEDAKRVADKLKINHIAIDFTQQFKKAVIDYFVDSYINGYTPNPCVVCNKYIKFGSLLNEVRKKQFDFLASGHYANIEFDGTHYLLKKGPDKKKDQSYVLYNLNQKSLKHIILPIGKFNKEEIRQLAKDFGLPIFNKPDSQEICFIKDNNYTSFISKFIKDNNKGYFVDKEGNVLGEHKGIWNYTVGQRKGIGSFGRPLFVLSIDPKTNRIILGEKGEEYSGSLYAGQLNWIIANPLSSGTKLRIEAKIRYTALPSPGEISLVDNDRIKLVFDQKQRAVTPGQAVVFYNDNIVLGGGIIESAE